MRLIALLALTLLTACTMPKREAAMAAEPVVVEEEPAVASVTDCQPGDDDGIGGTGCKVD
jgi:hypothetical protein